MANPDYRYSIGYALEPKKVESFIKPSLVHQAAERGIRLLRIETDKPLISQGPFDCVIHKLYGNDWKRQLDDYKLKNPKVVIVDSPDAIERLHNRISMLQVVSELKFSDLTASVSLGIPKQIVIYDAETLTDPRSWEGLKFPLIAKPLVADGSAKSHKMSLIFTTKGLINLKPPIVLQEFVNHGGVIFKVYVAGEYVKCVKRKSLPDVTEDKLQSFGGESISFSQVSNLGSANDEYYKMMQSDEFEMPPEEFITYVARGLRQALKLNLFNFDVIRDSSLANRYLVIDINYFPGYAKMPCYESVLTDFFLDVMKRKE